MLHAVDLGVMQYGAALELQRAAAHARIGGRLRDDVLLLLEHPPVVTLGRAAKAANVVVPERILAARGVELFDVERGGDATFHGPGQLVGYPILDLKGHTPDLHWYLRTIEEALMLVLHGYAVSAHRRAGFTGVWVGGPNETPRKIASIGVHARDWVTWHGFAFNVSTDLSYFDLIVPCGIQNVAMTTLEREREGSAGSAGSVGSERSAGSEESKGSKGSEIDFERVKEQVAEAFAAAFSCDLAWRTREQLSALVNE